MMTWGWTWSFVDEDSEIILSMAFRWSEDPPIHGMA